MRDSDQVFLSYSNQDRDIAMLLNQHLREHGVSTWSDQDLVVGTDWDTQVAKALEEAAAVVVLVTPNSLESDWVGQEWSRALSDSKRVIPVLAGGAGGEDVPKALAPIQAIRLDRDPERGVREIVDAVSQLERSNEPAASASVNIQTIVEDVVERKLASLGVDRPAAAEAAEKHDPRLVFVITSFQHDMEPAFEAINAAAGDVGLHAERAKDVPGDYRITDRILTSIRRAAFVVVDLTHERPNVYFELGFARGLGKTVVTIMREGTEAHFDVRDWTYLTYVDSRPLERDLTERFKYEVEQRDE